MSGRTRAPGAPDAIIGRMDDIELAVGAGLESVRGRPYRGELRPFRWFLLLWIALIYVYGLLSRETPLNVPPELFTALMGLHAVLHWYAPRLTAARWRRKLRSGLYFGVQG